MGLAQGRGEYVRARRGFSALSLLSSGEGNWDGVRVTEVGDLGLRGKEAGSPARLLCFSPSSRHRGPVRGRSSDARSRQARRSQGRPAGLARPSTGFPALSLPPL